ncbi:MAG: hypothetical protein HY722_08285 [Planctomycetes bacterium]|nr:hypothetical protein [Planctomycetota bacterium]
MPHHELAIEKDIQALQEILHVADEAFKDGIPEAVRRDLEVVKASIDQLKAVLVYRDNYAFFKQFDGGR